MSILTPGFPRTNPILSGIASIEAGEDADRALVVRDQLLNTPTLFATMSWEALGWLEPDAHEQASWLCEQVLVAWSRMEEPDRHVLWLDMVSVPPQSRFQSQLIRHLEAPAT